MLKLTVIVIQISKCQKKKIKNRKKKTGEGELEVCAVWDYLRLAGSYVNFMD